MEGKFLGSRHNRSSVGGNLALWSQQWRVVSIADGLIPGNRLGTTNRLSSLIEFRTHTEIVDDRLASTAPRLMRGMWNGVKVNQFRSKKVGWGDRQASPSQLGHVGKGIEDGCCEKGRARSLTSIFLVKSPPAAAFMTSAIEHTRLVKFLAIRLTLPVSTYDHKLSASSSKKASWYTLSTFPVHQQWQSDHLRYPRFLPQATLSSPL